MLFTGDLHEMSCQRALFFLTCVGCFVECSITVSPKEAAKYLGDTIVLRCTYPDDIQVVWFIRIGMNNPFPIASSNDNACLKQRKTVNGSHTIYSESDNVCVLEAINLKQNVTYLCLSKSDEQQDKAVVVVSQKPSTGESNTGQATGETLGLVAIILVTILVGIPLCITVVIGLYCYIKKRRGNQPVPEAGVPLITIDSNNAAAVASNNATVIRSPVTVDDTSNTSKNTASDATNPDESLDRTRVVLSAEERTNINFLIEDFLNFEFLETSDKISIQTGNLMEVLRELAYDVLGHKLTKGAYKIESIDNYIGKLKVNDINNVDADVKKLAKDEEVGLIKEDRKTHMMRYLETRLLKIAEKKSGELRACQKGVSEDSINEKYEAMENITYYLKDFSDSVLEKVSDYESDARNIKYNGLRCPYHQSCYVIKKAKYFKELIGNQWHYWLLLLYSFSKGSSSEDNKKILDDFYIQKKNCLDGINVIAEEKIKELNSASCTCRCADLEVISAMNGAIQPQRSGVRTENDYKSPLFRPPIPASKGRFVNDLSVLPCDGASSAIVDPKTKTSGRIEEVDLAKDGRDSGNSNQSITSAVVGQSSNSSVALHGCGSSVPVSDINTATSSSGAEFSEKPGESMSAGEQRVRCKNRLPLAASPKEEPQFDFRTDGGTDAESESDDKVGSLQKNNNKQYRRNNPRFKTQ